MRPGLADPPRVALRGPGCGASLARTFGPPRWDVARGTKVADPPRADRMLAIFLRVVCWPVRRDVDLTIFFGVVRAALAPSLFLVTLRWSRRMETHCNNGVPVRCPAPPQGVPPCQFWHRGPFFFSTEASIRFGLADPPQVAGPGLRRFPRAGLRAPALGRCPGGRSWPTPLAQTECSRIFCEVSVGPSGAMST